MQQVCQECRPVGVRTAVGGVSEARPPNNKTFLRGDLILVKEKGTTNGP